jgi:nucleotide-binding universal stress UspA family protein
MRVKPVKKSGTVLLESGPADDLLLERGERFGAEEKTQFQLKNILVPVDFSTCSKKALQYAIPFARKFNATLTLLYVVQSNYFPGGEFSGGYDFARLEKELRESGEHQLARLVSEELDESVPVKTSVRVGQPVAEILSAARELESDLILLSTHGRTGLKHVFLGSVAENVLRHAPCPVLVVREHEREFVRN